MVDMHSLSFEPLYRYKVRCARCKEYFIYRRNAHERVCPECKKEMKTMNNSYRKTFTKELKQMLVKLDDREVKTSRRAKS